MLIEFKGKSVLVVGAAFDIGREIAASFAENGARVHACDLLADEVENIAGSHGEGCVSAGFCDVTCEDSVRETVQAAAGETGVDILIYVAGGVAGQSKTPIEDVTLEQWKTVVDRNLTGLFLFAKYLVPIMKKQGKGRIITISSRAGLATSLTGVQAYCAAKHAQNGLVMQLGQELAPYNITVNAVAPGFLRSSPATRKQWDGYTQEFRDAFAARLVGGRIGKPEDIASAVMFLASDQAEWISGQILPVMGGPL